MTPTVDPALATYRLFWLNGAGRIERAADTVEAMDDTDAVGQALSLARGRAVEIWLAARRVAVLNAAKTAICRGGRMPDRPSFQA